MRLHEWIRVEDTNQSGDRMGIAAALGCSQATAKRELDTLRLTRRIEFVGPRKTGAYQLVDGSESVNLSYHD